MLDCVVELEHTPKFGPHSNSMVRKAFEEVVQGGALDALAKHLGIEIVFSGIALPRPQDVYGLERSRLRRGSKTHVIESFAEFAEEIKGSKPIS
jgi:hypothetical protein